MVKKGFSMSEETFGSHWEGQYQCMEKALYEGSEDDFGYEREYVLEYIQDFLKGCDSLPFNPFPHLRQSFPNYEWWLVECEKGLLDNNTKFEPARVQCDFFWPAAGANIGHDWVFARHKSRVGQGLALCGSAELMAKIKRLESRGAHLGEIAVEKIFPGAASYPSVRRPKPDI